MKIQKNIESAIDEIVSSLSTDDAIIKLNGYFKQYFWNNYLRVSYGKLHLEKSDFIEAGKWLYFHSNPNEAERRAIRRFTESRKNKKLLVFNSIVNKAKTPRGISSEMSQKIFSLILRISEEEGALPTNIVRWICNYNRIRNIEIEQKN